MRISRWCFIYWMSCFGVWPCAVPSPLQRSLSVPAVANTSWTSSSWRSWTDTGTPSASSAPTVRLRWRTNVSPGQEASTARRTSSSQWNFYSAGFLFLNVVNAEFISLYQIIVILVWPSKIKQNTSITVDTCLWYIHKLIILSFNSHVSNFKWFIFNYWYGYIDYID